ncbi:GNAT family N-acetyltransferase [Pseudomonas frederiksbergensis]|nr:GNAT family N-acetyltransferase [Pseudomonas frederiksbergensis]
MTDSITTRYASLGDVRAVSVLLDHYRAFYGQGADPEGSVLFLQERFYRGESTIIVAETEGQIIGFTQLFPSFSSVTLQRLWILNDLYVDEAYRSSGVGRLLLDAAKAFGEETKAKQLFIEGAVDNPRARGLYVSFGFIENTDYQYFHLPLTRLDS